MKRLFTVFYFQQGLEMKDFSACHRVKHSTIHESPLSITSNVTKTFIQSKLRPFILSLTELSQQISQGPFPLLKLGSLLFVWLYPDSFPLPVRFKRVKPFLLNGIRQIEPFSKRVFFLNGQKKLEKRLLMAGSREEQKSHFSYSSLFLSLEYGLYFESFIVLQ